MNQILYIKTEKKKSGTLEIKSVLRIFAILCIIFGLTFVGKASYAFFNAKNAEEKTIPSVEITQDEKILKLHIEHDKLIDKVIYTWNNEDSEVVLQGKGRKVLDEEIELNVGYNKLNLEVLDIDGNKTSFSEYYSLAAGDITEPEIEIEPDGSKLRIVAKDETAIDYMEFYWNDDDATKISATDLSPKRVEERIEVPKGENTLNIIAYDKAGNKSTKEQVCKGATKPKIRTNIEDKTLVITVEDDENVQKVDYELNGRLYSTDPENTGKPLDMKVLEIRQVLDDGLNKIIIKAYNTNGISAEITQEKEI